MGSVSGSGHLPQTPPRAFSPGRRHIYSESLINVLFILFRSLYGKLLDATVRGCSGDSPRQARNLAARETTGQKENFRIIWSS